MDARGVLTLLLVAANACAVPEDEGTIFSVNRSSEATGNCTTFATLHAALLAVSNSPAVTISLQSAAELPSWTVSKRITLQGNFNTLELTGKVSIPGSLWLFNTTLMSALQQDFSLDVTGTLTLTNCQLFGFAGLPIQVRGQVLVTNSTFKDNLKGVFSSIALGGRLTVFQSQFLTNAGISGAVFSVSPISESEPTLYNISNCRFVGNGNEAGSGVLLLNDLGAMSAGEQTISFSKCNFTDHSATTFTITTKLFNVDISDCLFERETKLIAGTLLGTNVNVSRIAVTRSKGPLFVLTFSGIFNLTNSNFTYISTGPLVTAVGQSVSSSLVCLSQLRVFNISNWSPSTSANLINAVTATVWLQTVTIDQFSGDKSGIFAVVSCLFFSRNLTAYHATANAYGVGTTFFSTFVVNDTLIEGMNSGASMWTIYQSSGNITRITYRAVIGNMVPVIGVYSVNLYSINMGSCIRVEGIDIMLEREGTPLIFIRYANLTVTNSTFAGRLGKGILTVQNSLVVLRNLSFHFTSAQLLVFGLLNATIDWDHLSLRNTFFPSTILSLSTGNSVRIQQLSLLNVTCQGLSKGPLYSLEVEAASIENSTIEALVFFSIYVNVTFGNLVMRHTVGSLFCAFSSELTVAQASIFNVTVPRIFLYLVHSNASLSSAALDNFALSIAGGLATVLSQSTLRLTAVLMSNMLGVEHGALSLDHSALILASSSFTRSNVSLIVAQQTSVSILETAVSDILLNQPTIAHSMVPNGSLLSCLDCPSIVIAGVRCSELSANKGGAIYATQSEDEHSSTVLLERSEFENCQARTSGGVISAKQSALRIFQCGFRNNTAVYGGVVSFLGATRLDIANSSFYHNAALIAGSCVRWTGLQPTWTFNQYANNSALYGNPLASDPHHFQLLAPGSLLPLTDFPILGVTGQRMDQPLLVGVFDIYGQLITSDNSTVVYLNLSQEIKGMSSSQPIAEMGVATLSYLFYPFSSSTHTFTVYSAGIASLTFSYQFRDCQPGETRSPTGCFPCAKNSYSVNILDSFCRTCPAHVQCYGRAALELDRDYWRANNLTDVIYSCLVLGSCQGGFDSTCASGYTGALCSSCTQGYFRFAGWMCINCEQEVSVVARGFIVALLLMSTSVLLPQLYLRKEDIIFRVALVFRIFLQHTQVLMFVALIHAQWGFRSLVYHEVMRVLASIGGLWIFAGCQYQGMHIEQYYFQLIAVSFYPILFLLACLLIWLLVNCKRLRDGSDTLSSILAATWVCVYHYSPVFCLLVVGMWQCKVVEGRNLLVADMTQTCWTGSHLRYVFTVTIPLMILLTINHGVAFVCILKPPSSRIFAACHSYLTAGLKEEHKNWEIRMSICRIAMAFLSLCYSNLEGFSSAILLSCIIGFTIQSYVKWVPYQRPVHNTMAVFGQFATLGIMFAGVQGGDSAVLTFACLGTLSVIVLGLLALRKVNIYTVMPTFSQKQWSPYKHEEIIYQVSSMEASEGYLHPPPPSNEVSHQE